MKIIYAQKLNWLINLSFIFTHIKFTGKFAFTGKLEIALIPAVCWRHLHTLGRSVNYDTKCIKSKVLIQYKPIFKKRSSFLFFCGLSSSGCNILISTTRMFLLETSVIAFVGFGFEHYFLRDPVQDCDEANVFCHYRRLEKAPNELWLNNRGDQTGGSLTDSQAAEENSLQSSVKMTFSSSFFAKALVETRVTGRQKQRVWSWVSAVVNQQ